MCCDAVCCNALEFAMVRDMLQCVAVCCSVLQCVAVCCSVLQCVAVCCRVLQGVAGCHIVLQHVRYGCATRYTHTEIATYISHAGITTDISRLTHAAYMLTFVHTINIRTNDHAYMHAKYAIHTYIHAYIHTCVHRYIHAYTHTYVHA